jgi:hypothetical protein
MVPRRSVSSEGKGDRATRRCEPVGSTVPPGRFWGSDSTPPRAHTP